MAVEPVALLRLVRSVHAVPVQGAGVHIGQVDVPDAVGRLGHGDGRARGRVGRVVEEAQLDRGGVLGEQGEVDPAAVPGGAERMGTPRPDPHGAGSLASVP